MSMAGRKDWVQADLRCLMCGRVIGRLVGPLPSSEEERRARAGRPPQFAAFRPADSTVPAVRSRIYRARLALRDMLNPPPPIFPGVVTRHEDHD